MLTTSTRLLRLLSLLQSRRDWSAAELAERLDVDRRTVRRDVERLRGLGYPVRSSPGTGGGYRLAAGTAMPPLLLDDAEAVAVAVGLRTAAVGSVAGIEETAVRALAKLDQVLPTRLRGQVATLAAMTVPLSAGAPTVEPTTLAALAAACRDHERLRFDYTAADGTASVRRTEPARLVHTGRVWYLLAWDLDRADWRTFRVDRLSPRIPTGPRFVPREPPADIAAYTSRAVSTEPYRYRARLTVLAPAEAVAAVVSPTSATITAADDDRCELVTGGNSLDSLAIYLAVLGFDFHLHEPPELVAHLRVVGERLLAAAG